MVSFCSSFCNSIQSNICNIVSKFAGRVLFSVMFPILSITPIFSYIYNYMVYLKDQVFNVIRFMVFYGHNSYIVILLLLPYIIFIEIIVSFKYYNEKIKK